MKLFHFSEDPSIEVFGPRWHERQQRALVWAIDEEHSPLYWFPRDCPRCTWWSDTQPRIHATEWAWYERMRDCRLYAYALPPEAFEPMADASGYWISPEPVAPMARRGRRPPHRAAPRRRDRIALRDRCLAAVGRGRRVGPLPVQRLPPRQHRRPTRLEDMR